MRPLLALLLALPLLLGAARQERGDARLEVFVARVARLWEAEDEGALAGLAPRSGRILLEVAGEGGGEVGERHAAAVLRSLFSGRETVSIRPARVTVAGGRPLQGFGELTWVFRPRGITDTESSSVYVGAVWEGGAWRIRELRVLR